MKNVTDRVSNPFGMRPPCSHRCHNATNRRAVLGYGDANADFHVIGDHPGIHGGTRTGIPFTGSDAGAQILDVLAVTGFLSWHNPPHGFDLENCFLSYLYCCCVPPGTTPNPREYGVFERFFDAELRAIQADVLIPVGERPIERVLEEYTSQSHRAPPDPHDLHGREVRGRGFLVIPLTDPRDWGSDEYTAAVDAIEAVRSRDYHQMVDLGRFLPDPDPYFVR